MHVQNTRVEMATLMSASVERFVFFFNGVFKCISKEVCSWHCASSCYASELCVAWDQCLLVFGLDG